MNSIPRRTIVKLSLGSLLLSLLIASTGCDLLPQRSEGEKLWRSLCAECHGIDGSGNRPRYMGKVYADLLDDTWRTGGDRIAVESVIREGVFGEMPAFDQLTREEMRVLLGYLDELRSAAR
ncbi:MAG: c-type cytochrome [Acidobacteriota bacterium]